MKRTYPALIFLCIVAIAVLGIVGHNFKRYYLDKDYTDIAITACDPAVHSCFKADEGNPDPNIVVPLYEKVEINAAYAPACLDEHTCPAFSCASVRGYCVISYCTSGTREEGETCTDTPEP